MNFKFHHMNICTDNLPRLTKFYKQLFDLGTISDKEHTVVSGIREDRAYTGKVDFLTDVLLQARDRGARGIAIGRCDRQPERENHRKRRGLWI